MTVVLLLVGLFIADFALASLIGLWIRGNGR